MAPESRKLIARSLQGPIDWQYIMAVTQRNAVKPLFSSNMLGHFSDHLPPEIMKSITEELQSHVQRNMFLTAKLIELVKLFSANGINALPFKGPLLAIKAYGNPALRRYGDLDVLVKPRHFERAVQILTENGYTPRTSVSWLNKKNWYISRKKDIYFTDESGSINLELHWKLSGSHFGLPREMNGLWDRLIAINVGGTKMPSLSFNDLLIYLCLHGSRHGWERLAWVCDVNELIRSEKDIDWNSVAEDAKRFGCENVVALGLRLTRDLFGLQLPAGSVFNDLMNVEVYDNIVAEIRTALFSDASKQTEIGDRYAYHLKLKERSTDRLKLHYHYLSWYLTLLLTPNEKDRDVMHFPHYLSPLYYVTRPFRLLFSYIGNRSTPTPKSESR